MDNNSNKTNMTEKDLEGIKEMRAMNQEFLGSGGDGSKAVLDYLTKANDDDALMLRFLKGRKYRPKHAWETLKKYAEVKFDTYPEVFPPTFPSVALPLTQNCIIGVLKARDSKGRRIAYFDANEWNTQAYSMEILTTAATKCAERLLLDEDCMNNGLVFIQECGGMGMKHAKLYTLPDMLRFMNVFWYAFPLKLKGVYYVNVPYLLSFIYGIIKPFFPKKLKERFVLTSSGKKFEALHERLSPDILPKCLGGKLENHEACDMDLLKF